MSETKSIPRMHGDEPDCSYITAEIGSIPRMHGDEPRARRIAAAAGGYSPYARG